MSSTQFYELLTKLVDTILNNDVQIFGSSLANILLFKEIYNNTNRKNKIIREIYPLDIDIYCTNLDKFVNTINSCYNYREKITKTNNKYVYKLHLNDITQYQTGSLKKTVMLQMNDYTFKLHFIVNKYDLDFELFRQTCNYHMFMHNRFSMYKDSKKIKYVFMQFMRDDLFLRYKKDEININKVESFILSQFLKHKNTYTITDHIENDSRRRMSYKQDRIDYFKSLIQYQIDHPYMTIVNSPIKVLPCESNVCKSCLICSENIDYYDSYYIMFKDSSNTEHTIHTPCFTSYVTELMNNSNDSKTLFRNQYEYYLCNNKSVYLVGILSTQL